MTRQVFTNSFYFARTFNEAELVFEQRQRRKNKTSGLQASKSWGLESEMGFSSRDWWKKTPATTC
jgi:hypothetical protein